MDLIKDLNWRYATKKFDATRKVSDENLAVLKEAVNLAASSYGLQPFTVLQINDSNIREQLKPVSWGQGQITDASHLFVFCNHNKVTPENIDAYLKLKSDKQGIPLENLNQYGDFMKSKIGEFSDEQQAIWTGKQTYIAMANLLNACAHLQIDACPIEGFDNGAYDEILNLRESGMSSSVVVAVGYRSEEDLTQNQPKVRKPIAELFQEI